MILSKEETRKHGQRKFRFLYWEGTGASKHYHRQPGTFRHALFRLANPHTRVIVLLVWCILRLGISNLSLKVVVIGGNEFAHSVPVRPLGIGVDVHLDSAGVDGSMDFLVSRSRTSVHHEEDRFVGVASVTELGLRVVLVLRKALRREFHVSWLVLSIGRGDKEEGKCGSAIWGE